MEIPQRNLLTEIVIPRKLPSLSNLHDYLARLFLFSKFFSHLASTKKSTIIDGY